MKNCIFAFSALVLLALACSKEEEPTPTPDPPKPVVHVQKVMIASNTNVGLRDSAFVKAIVLPEDATDKRLKWYSLDTTIATVDSCGMVVGRNRKISTQDATVKIVAVSVDGSIKAEGQVTVTVSQIKLTPEMVSSNLPMQYVCWGWTPDGDWDESLGNRAITQQQSDDRLARYGRAENMWDLDSLTDYHVNFDLFVQGYSWSQRKGATTEFPYIQFDFGETLSCVNVYLTVSSTAWFDGHCGFRLEFSPDGSTYMDLAEADRLSVGIHEPLKGVAGEKITLLRLKADHLSMPKTFRGFRIVPTHGYTSVKSEHYWGIAEIKVERVLL